MSTPAGQDGGEAPPVLRAPTFVGREGELATAVRALGCPPALVLVEGEAGSGKSRLLAQLLAAKASRPGRVLVGVCAPFRRRHTLGPVVDAIRRAPAPAARVGDLRLSELAGALRPLLPEWSDELPPAPAPAPPPDAIAARHRLFGALLELLNALRVGVLVLEDVQWADDATAEFVLFLGSRRPPRVSVVATCRPTGLGSDSLLPRLVACASPGFAQACIRMGPLTAAESTALASSMLPGGPISPRLGAFLHTNSGGVPLAVEELVRWLYGRAELVLDGDGWSLRHTGTDLVPDLVPELIPPAVCDAVAERVRRLDVRTRAILHAAAVLAEAADPAVVRAVSGLPPDDAAAGLALALQTGLVAEDRRGLIVFRGASAARAADDGIPASARRQMHARAARTLQGDPRMPAARLAGHFREAGDHAAWCRHAERAVDQALAAGDEALGAAMLCDLVIRIDHTPAELLRLVRKYDSAALIGHDRLTKLAESLRIALDDGRASPHEAAGLRVRLGRILFDIRQFEAGRAQLEQAVGHPDLATADRARAMILLGRPLGSRWPVWVHARWLRQAAEVVARVEPPERHALEMERATGLLMLGEGEGWPAVAAVDEVSATLPPGRRIAHDLSVSDLAMAWGRFPEARCRLTRALTTAELHAYPASLGMTLVNLVRLDWLRGSWSDLAERAGSLADDRDLPAVGRSGAKQVIAMLGSVIGSGGDPRVELESLVASSPRFDPWSALGPVAALVRILLEDGEVDAALAVTEDPISMLTRTGLWIWGTDLVPARVAALLQAGRADDAARLIMGFARGLRGRDAPGPQAALRTCRAMLAAHTGFAARAAGMFGAAADAWALLPRPYEALLARERRARCLLLAAGDEQAQAQALSQLSQTAQGLTVLGARRDAERVDRFRQEHEVGAAPARRRGRPSYGAALSPRERQVTDLMADGRSNDQIAGILQLSPHTVRMHVKSAMRKLQVPSRSALSRRAAELRDAAAGRSSSPTAAPGQ